MRTIVHVGFHKTGTTTLQDCLSQHRELLAAEGVHYPADPHCKWAGTHRLACWLSSPRALDGPNDLFTPGRERFSEMTGARNCSSAYYLGALMSDLPVTVLSSEIFETFNRAELSRLRSFVGPIDRFVLYVRNGIDYIYSCWSARVREGYTRTFAEFLRATVDFEAATPLRGPLLFTQLLNECFGQDRIVVRNLATASLHPRRLIGYFLEEELKLEPSEAMDRNLRSNVSPPYVVTEVMRMQNLRAGSSRAESRKALNNALSGPDGAEVLDEFTRRLAPVMKTISIGQLAPARISSDGSIRDLGEPLGSLFSGWRFELDEQRPTCGTQDLLAALEHCDTFTGLCRPSISGTAGSPRPSRPKSVPAAKRVAGQTPKFMRGMTGAGGSLLTAASRFKALFTTRQRGQ